MILKNPHRALGATALVDSNPIDTDEGRLARWARLKRDGGANLEEEKAAKLQLAREPEQEDTVQAEGVSWQTYQLPESLAMPGGVRVRNVVPPMLPLAPNDGDDDNAEGIEAPPSEALVMLAGEIVHDPNNTIGGEDEDDERSLTPEETEAVATLPAIESLTDESDFHPFMASNIPDFIRRRALRVLFRSHPLLTFRDGLNDYDEDFNVIDKLINALTDTSYDLEKGQPGPEPEPKTEAKPKIKSELKTQPDSEEVVAPESEEVVAKVDVVSDTGEPKIVRGGI